MAQQKVVNVNIEIDFNLLTLYDVGEITNHILKFLAYQRCQIPFVYNIFDHKVASFQQRSEQELEKYTHLTKYNVQRNREQAQQTKDALGALSTLIKNVFNTNMVKTVRFLFGATMFTPKEVYTVHVPAQLMHKTRRHLPLPAAIINELMLKLIMDENLSNLFSKPLNTTSIYMDMEVSPSDTSENCMENMHRKTLARLPQNCRNVHFHVVHKTTIEKIIVHQDDGDDDNDAQYDFVNQNSVYNIPTEDPCYKETTLEWWESLIIVRGFKDSTNKKINIW